MFLSLALLQQHVGSSGHPNTDQGWLPTQVRQRRSSRGPWQNSFSCLPAIDGRRICGARNPIVVNEVDETDEEFDTRMEQWKHDLGEREAMRTVEKNVLSMKYLGVQAFITLEPGHKLECQAERFLLEEKFQVSSDEARDKARSCGSDAAGSQAQGDPFFLKNGSRLLGDGERWALNPIPDSASVRLPYLRLFRKQVDQFFTEFCTPDHSCRVMTHCVGGNGRTGFMMMSYWMSNLAQSRIGSMTKGAQEHDYIFIRRDTSRMGPMYKSFAALRNSYYHRDFSAFEPYENSCSRSYCNLESPGFLHQVLNESELAHVDQCGSESAWPQDKNKCLEKLRARCIVACSICDGQALDRKWDGEGNVYKLGSWMPRGAVETILITMVVRSLRAGEFFHINPSNRPPGQCMRLIQWWHCLHSESWWMKYTIPPIGDLVLDCKDPTLFNRNEFGVYMDWHRAASLENTSDALIGPEENSGNWDASSHERVGGKGATTVVSCPDDPDDTMECHLTPEHAHKLNAARAHDTGSLYFTDANMQALALLPKRSKSIPLWMLLSVAIILGLAAFRYVPRMLRYAGNKKKVERNTTSLVNGTGIEMERLSSLTR